MKSRTTTAIAVTLLLLTLTSTQLLIPVAKAGYDLGYGPSSILWGSYWQQREIDVNQMNYAYPQIYNLFAEQGSWDEYYQEWVPTYGLLYDFREDWEVSTVISEVNHVEHYDNHDWGAVFYYGHYGIYSIEGYPDYHLGFHEAGERLAYSTDVIWDEDIYPYTGNQIHNFVFLWVCDNARDIGDDEPEPHGMPYCWFRRNLSYNGYSYPDAGPDCFIGFYQCSPTLSEGMGTYTYPYGENIYKFWLVFFYYFALNGYSIKGALDMASYMVEYDGYWLDSNNRLSQGYEYWFPGWQGPGDSPEEWEDMPPGPYPGQMKIYGNGNIYLPSAWWWT